jgi:Trp operon repressor
MALIAGGLVACAGSHPAASHVVLVPVEQTKTKFVVPKDAVSITSLLRSIDRFDRLPEQQRHDALSKAEAKYHRHHSAENRLRLGIMYALSSSPADVDRALDLLKGHDWIDGHETYEMLARLVISSLDEQQALQARVAATRQALTAERSQRDQLKRKLNALKAIEESMSNRDGSKEPPP